MTAAVSARHKEALVSLQSADAALEGAPPCTPPLLLKFFFLITLNDEADRFIQAYKMETLQSLTKSTVLNE